MGPHLEKGRLDYAIRRLPATPKYQCNPANLFCFFLKLRLLFYGHQCYLLKDKKHLPSIIVDKRILFYIDVTSLHCMKYCGKHIRQAQNPHNIIFTRHQK